LAGIYTNKNTRVNIAKKQNLLQNRLFWGFVVVSLVLLFILPMKAFIFLPLIALNILISWFRNYANFRYIGIEVILFTTVLGGMLLGLVGGIIIALISVAINYIFSGQYIGFILITLPLYTAIAIIASFLPITSIVTAGIIFVIAYNLIGTSIAGFIGGRPAGLTVFAVTNIVFNLLIFLRFGPLIISMVGA